MKYELRFHGKRYVVLLLLVAFALSLIVWNVVRLAPLTVSAVLEQRKSTSATESIGANSTTTNETHVSLPFAGFSSTSRFTVKAGETLTDASSSEGATQPETWADAATRDGLTSIPTPRDALRAWCVIDKTNMNPHFRHFPHTMQSLAPCWSYFAKLRTRYAAQNKEVQCGLYLNETGIRWSQVSQWSRQLVDAWNCTVVHDPPPPEAFREHWRHGGGWFRTASDADSMRNQVLGGSRRAVSATRALVSPRIGLVQRIRARQAPSRIVLNVDEIVEALRQAFPSALVELTNMSDFSLLEQARWWNSQDLVVLAHGAAVTNAIFMEPRVSSVVEIFPDGYRPYMFQALMRSCQVRSYSISRNTSATARHRGHPRNVDLRPNVAQVILLTKLALNQSASAE